jgi:hypothetical protein
MEEIKIGIYYYIDDEGNKVYDEDEIRDEFERKLQELLNENK